MQLRGVVFAMETMTSLQEDAHRRRSSGGWQQVFGDLASHEWECSYRAKREMCRLTCRVFEGLESALCLPRHRTHLSVDKYHSHLFFLAKALHELQGAGDPVDDPSSDALAPAMCRTSVRLATAFTEEAEFLASLDGREASMRLLDAISRAEARVVNLMTRFYNDRQDVASALCQIGRQKIRVLARGEVLGSVYEAPFREDVQREVRWVSKLPCPYHFKVLSTIFAPLAEVAEGLAQLLSNPDLRVRDEVRTVLLGIHSLGTLAFDDSEIESILRERGLFARLEHHFEVRASFPALSMRATSEDLERFKDQTRPLCNAARTSAVSPPVTVGGLCDEDTHGWLQRQEPESRSELGAWQQHSSAGSWILCSPAPASLLEASSADSRTISSSLSRLSSWTFDLVDS